MTTVELVQVGLDVFILFSALALMVLSFLLFSRFLGR